MKGAKLLLTAGIQPSEFLGMGVVMQDAWEKAIDTYLGEVESQRKSLNSFDEFVRSKTSGG